MEDKTPEDDLDAICKRHDTCYDNEERLDCDKKIVEELESLDSDPLKWTNPPKTDEDIAYAKKYVKLAKIYFKFRVREGEFEKLLREDPSGILPLMP